jgi:hypothetical protein
MEDKATFVSLLQEALISCGDGRYDHLMDKACHINEYGSMTVLEYGNRKVDVTCDSLTSIAKEVIKLIA